MQTTNRSRPFRRLSLISALAAGIAACGSQATRAEDVAECSVSLSARSTALEVQRVVQAVLSGDLDPCGGSVGPAGASRELLRIDSDDQDIRIFFRIVRRLGGEYRPLLP